MLLKENVIQENIPKVQAFKVFSWSKYKHSHFLDVTANIYTSWNEHWDGPTLETPRGNYW